MFRNIVIGLLIASCSLGSFPAGVGAYQVAQTRDNITTALAGYARAQSDMAARMELSNAEMSDGGGYTLSDTGASHDEGVTEVELGDNSSYGETQADAQVVRASADGAQDQAAAADAAEAGSTEPAAQDAANADATSSAQQDAAQIEGAEVLQQGDGETTGNVLVADRAAVEALGGRDFMGQSTKAINGVTYILIGNEQQLRAIGSDKKVISGQVWSIQQHWVKDGITGLTGHWEDDKGTEALAYAGDADLAATDTLHNGTFKDHEGGGLSQETRTKYYVVGENGRDDDVSSAQTGLKYTIDANYLIFRDIDLSTNAADPNNTGWEPLMFSSTMLGAKSDTPGTAGTLWNYIGDDGKSITDVTKVANPVIFNVKVIGTGELSIAKQSGVGFFGTISNEHDDKSIFARPTKATVSNITLDGVVVDNQYTGVHIDKTLVSELVGLLGGLVDGVLDILLGLLGIKTSDLIEELLTIRKNDPSSLATGGFAGRIVGDVEVSGCEVHEVSVSSRNAMTGGFAGYVQGETLYGPISGLSGDLVKVLAGLLNIVPGVGLGDVITLLLGKGNILDVSKLIPQDYLNPIISHCSVRDFV